MALGTAFSPLREQPYRALFVGRTVSTLGTTVAPIALAFAILDLTGSAVDLGMVLAANVAPQVLLPILGGVLADRVRRSHVMIVSNVVSAIGQGGIAWLILAGTPAVWQLAALAAVTGAASAFFGPASQGVLPQTVSPARLQEANALIRLALNTIRVAGPAVGGIAVAVAGPGWVIAWDAMTFLVAAVALARVRVPLTERQPASFVSELRDGWTEFWSRTWLWAVVIQYSVVNMIWVGAFLLLGPVVADQQLGGPAAWGMIMAALAAGLLLGGVVMLAWHPQRPLLAGSLATLTHALPFVPLAVGAPLPVIMVSTVIAGIGIEIFGVTFALVMQQQIPPNRLSRVASYDLLFGVALMPLGYLIAGPLSAMTSAATVLIGSAIAVTAATVAVMAIHDVRAVRSQSANAEPRAAPTDSPAVNPTA
jgi:MFS family permease